MLISCFINISLCKFVTVFQRMGDKGITKRIGRKSIKLHDSMQINSKYYMFHEKIFKYLNFVWGGSAITEQYWGKLS